MRTRIDEHTAGYGDWGLWHTLFFAGRIAEPGHAYHRLADLDPPGEFRRLE